MVSPPTPYPHKEHFNYVNVSNSDIKNIYTNPLKLIDQKQNLSNTANSCHKSTNSIFSTLPLQNQLEGNTTRERRGWPQIS